MTEPEPLIPDADVPTPSAVSGALGGAACTAPTSAWAGWWRWSKAVP